MGVHEGTIILEPLEGVAGVTVHMMVTIRSSAVGKEDHDLVNGLWVLGKVVLSEEFSLDGRLSKKRPNYPEHVRVLQVGLRVPLLCVNEVGELGRVTDEEDGGVIEDPIPVTFISSELDGEATGVASGVGRARFTTDGRETDCSADFLSHRSQQRLGCNVTKIMGDLEVTVSTSTFGMDLWRNISVKLTSFMRIQ